MKKILIVVYLLFFAFIKVSFWFSWWWEFPIEDYNPPPNYSSQFYVSDFLSDKESKLWDSFICSSIIRNTGIYPDIYDIEFKSNNIKYKSSTVSIC